MTIKALVVDDSNFFCRRVAQLLSSDPDIKVVGIANNGQEAVAKAQKLKPDIITLDVEMPVMDGITALKEIMRTQPTAVLMLSSLTYEGAKLTLDALEFGAVDFMLKSYEGISQGNSKLARGLIDKIKEIASSKATARPSGLLNQPNSAPANFKQSTVNEQSRPQASAPQSARASVQPGRFKLIAIGASTGGPVVLQNMITQLPADLRVPVTITQHMPGTFTGAFAQRINGLSKLNVVEALDNQPLKPAHVYIAPGGKQMYIEGSLSNARIRVRETDSRLQYAPCVDVTYASAAKVYQDKVLAIVLTGMGADGREGAKILKSSGSSVWTQDEASCVVYGMPMSVKKAGLSDRELPAGSFAQEISRMF